MYSTRIATLNHHLHSFASYGLPTPSATAPVERRLRSPLCGPSSTAARLPGLAGGIRSRHIQRHGIGNAHPMGISGESSSWPSKCLRSSQDELMTWMTWMFPLKMGWEKKKLDKSNTQIHLWRWDSSGRPKLWGVLSRFCCLAKYSRNWATNLPKRKDLDGLGKKSLHNMRAFLGDPLHTSLQHWTQSVSSLQCCQHLPTSSDIFQHRQGALVFLQAPSSHQVPQATIQGPLPCHFHSPMRVPNSQPLRCELRLLCWKVAGSEHPECLGEIWTEYFWIPGYDFSDAVWMHVQKKRKH